MATGEKHPTTNVYAETMWGEIEHAAKKACNENNKQITRGNSFALYLYHLLHTKKHIVRSRVTSSESRCEYLSTQMCHRHQTYLLLLFSYCDYDLIYYCPKIVLALDLF